MIHKKRNSHRKTHEWRRENSRKLPPFRISISFILSRFKCTNFFPRLHSTRNEINWNFSMRHIALASIIFLISILKIFSSIKISIQFISIDSHSVSKTFLFISPRFCASMYRFEARKWMSLEYTAFVMELFCSESENTFFESFWHENAAWDARKSYRVLNSVICLHRSNFSNGIRQKCVRLNNRWQWRRGRKSIGQALNREGSFHAIMKISVNYFHKVFALKVVVMEKYPFLSAEAFGVSYFMCYGCLVCIEARLDGAQFAVEFLSE